MCSLRAVAWSCALLPLLIGGLQSPAAASSVSNGSPAAWQVLTRANFSSQIRLHPHVLLVVTMPWYGESRSLMAEIEHLVASNEQELGQLKLMVVYRNSDKPLADAIGSTEAVKFIYYQYSTAFKYQGKLRAQEIVSSVRYTISLKNNEAPFVVLHTKEDVEMFMESTDKSVLLYESCGWFTRLSQGGSNQSYEAASLENHTENDDITGKTLTRESYGQLELVVDDEELAFGGGSQHTCSPWKVGFTLANESVSDQIEDTGNGNVKACMVQNFHQFESFYAELTSIARAYFLPPEKVRFGLIKQRSSLPLLDVVNEGSLRAWFLTIHYMGCTTCSVIAKEGDDLRSLVQSNHKLNIKEIDVDENGGKVVFPSNMPLAILFIDRFSHSSKVRDESISALKLLRQYVQRSCPFHVSTGALGSSTPRVRSKVVHPMMNTGISDSQSEAARMNAWASKLMAIGDKMSVMVVNDGDSISFGSSSHGTGGNPLYDILTKLLHKTRPGHRSKKTRISLAAKDFGLKLLSDDSEVQTVQDSKHEVTDDSFALSDNFNEGTAEVSIDAEKATETETIDAGHAPIIVDKTPASYPDEQNNDLDSNITEMEDQSKTEPSGVTSAFGEEVSYNAYSSSEAGGILHNHKVEKMIAEVLDISEPGERNMHTDQEEFGSQHEQDDGSSVLDQKPGSLEDAIYQDNKLNIDDRSEENDNKCPPHEPCSSFSSLVDDTDYAENATSALPDSCFAGSFYVSDGGYRFLRTLTDGSRFPSLVIIDPVQQEHYVFPEETEFSYASLQNYFEGFVNQSLPSYQRAASSAINSKELPRPPFVNQDFHEANSIPQLTANDFCPLVFGSTGCDSKNEVPSSNAESLASPQEKDVLVLFSNSWCGFCHRAELVVRELHRSFKSLVSYSHSGFANGQDVHTKEKTEGYTMKGFPAIYMIDCTSNECRHLLKSAGMEELYPTLLLFPAGNTSAIAYEGGMSVANLIEFLESHVSNSRHLSEYRGLMLRKRRPRHDDAPEAVQFHINDKSSTHVGNDLPSHSSVVAGSILTATERLSMAAPFDNSRVLIVSADSHLGFHGLMINKRLSWGVFKNLDSSMEPIKHAPLSYGGPVMVQGYHLVCLSRVAQDGFTEVIPGVYYGDIIATSRAITRIKSGEQSADDLWFFLGYSGWGYSQLFDELSEGSWHVNGKPVEHLDWPEK